ncbi:MAG: MBL fold metallo-hydrolase [Gammaproteobacteria bacterium]|nr:MBL fold metallo-hydrolase [Gammaproteobacteria bacterium]
MATIQFLGAAREVTGSCYLLSTRASRVLLECGARQGRDAEEADRENHDELPAAPGDIHAVILSHAHLDHSGALPRLVRKGFRGPIYCTPATADLLRVLLLDAVFLHLKDIQAENRWRERAGKPLLEPQYMPEDCETVLKQCVEVGYGEATVVSSDVSLRFHDAGHILGSAIVELEIGERGESRRVVFSGDLGNAESVLMPPPSAMESADVVLMEGTYGDRDHRPYAETVAEFAEALEAAHRDGGNVLIPAFAVGRTQEVLFHLARLHGDGKLKQSFVVLDSPMAIDVTQLYQRHRALLDPGDLARLGGSGHFKQALDFLRLARTPEDSMAINRFRSGAIIIAGSGMCEGGRIRHHLKHNLWRRQTHLIFVGFQAQGTLGRRIVDGAESVRLFGQEIAVKAQIHTLGGFSAHAGQAQLLGWARHFKGKPRFHLVHGEERALSALQSAMRRRDRIESIAPRLNDVVEI